MGGLDTRAGERPYWEDMDYSGANQIVKGNLMTGQRAAITIGYYLKHIRDNRLYLEGGYQSFGEYVRAECGLSESTASRHIARMEQFSEGGNSPKLAARYAEYSASQLQEMLYLTDEQREQASPDMTVKEIRAIRQEENMVAGIDLACEHSDNGVCVVLSDAETEQPCIEGPCPYEEDCDVASEEVVEVTVELPKDDELDGTMDPQQKLSVYGLPLREYPEDSLIATPGCGPHDCYSCHQSGCDTRQRWCYCVEATMGNPFPCEMIDRTSDLDDSCQFIDQPAAYHRAGDGEAVPCCKNCKNPCEHICSRAAEKWEVATSQEQDIWSGLLHDMPLFSRQSVRDYIADAEAELKEYMDCDGLPPTTVLREQMFVAGLRLLLQAVEKREEAEHEES